MHILKVYLTFLTLSLFSISAAFSQASDSELITIYDSNSYPEDSIPMYARSYKSLFEGIQEHENYFSTIIKIKDGAYWYPGEKILGVRMYIAEEFNKTGIKSEFKNISTGTDYIYGYYKERFESYLLLKDYTDISSLSGHKIIINVILKQNYMFEDDWNLCAVFSNGNSGISSAQTTMNLYSRTISTIPGYEGYKTLSGSVDLRDYNESSLYFSGLRFCSTNIDQYDHYEVFYLKNITAEIIE